jgi:DNA-binding response OmpR family regulator
VYGVVTNHGGGVAVSSQPNVGTSVRLYLPAERRAAKDAGVGAEDLGGKETILLVDDEELLLSMGQTVLSAYGYRVLTANSGEKALGVLAKPETAVDLVITDLVMPSMSGRELVEKIRHGTPGMRILCVSGYAWPAGQPAEEAYLQKPFTTQELLGKVRAVLGGQPSEIKSDNMS